MVMTRKDTKTSLASSEMDLPSPSPAPGPSLMEKAKANENARLANETWFNKVSDGSTLDDLMENFDARNVNLIEVTTEKNCREMLTQSPGEDLIRKNKAKNIRMFFNKLPARV